MNVLIPTDFSENAYNAISYVYKHFVPKKTKITIVHTIKEPHSTSTILLRIEDLMKKDAENDMNILLDRIKNEFGHRPNYKIKYGYLKNWLQQYGDSLEIDLVVMGTKGRSNVSSKIMGSVTESVIRSSKKPVLAIPQDISAEPLHHFVFATAYDKLECEDFIIELVNSIINKAPVLEILQVIKPNSDIKVPKSIPFNGLQLGVCTINNSNPVNGINDYLENNRVDILGIFHSRNSRLDYLFNRSITKTICGRTKTPLLVIPSKS